MAAVPIGLLAVSVGAAALRSAHAQEFALPIRWCAVEGSPAVDNPGAVGETATDMVLWRRHERISDSVFIPQAGVTWRSAFTEDVRDDASFPVLADPDTSIGDEGDVLHPNEDPPGPGRPGDEYRELRQECIDAWDRLLPEGTEADIGVLALNTRRIVNASGDPRTLGTVSGAGFGNREVLLEDNAFTLAGSDLLPAGTATDPMDITLGHEAGHALPTQETDLTDLAGLRHLCGTDMRPFMMFRNATDNDNDDVQDQVDGLAAAAERCGLTDTLDETEVVNEVAAHVPGCTEAGTTTECSAISDVEVDEAGEVDDGGLDLAYLFFREPETATPTTELTHETFAPISEATFQHVCPLDPTQTDFTDRGTIPEAHRDNVDCAALLNIVVGFADNTYRPSLDVRRDQMASFIARTLDVAAGVELPAATEGGTFTDVASGNPHRDNIRRLEAAGIVQGGPLGRGANEYGPGLSTRRDQMTSLMIRAAEFALDEEFDSSTQQFPDVPETNVHFENVNFAAENGIVLGLDPVTFDPDAFTRRDQMASFVVRLLDFLPTPATTPEYWTAVDLDGDETSGGDATTVGMPSDFEGAELVTRVSVVRDDDTGTLSARPTVWRFEANQLAPLEDNRIGGLIDLKELTMEVRGPDPSESVVPLGHEVAVRLPNELRGPRADVVRMQGVVALDTPFVEGGETPDRLGDPGVRMGLQAPQFPTCTVTPDPTGPGERAQVDAQGLVPDEPAHMVFGAEQVAEDQADADGNVSITFNVPEDVEDGLHLVSVGTDGTALTADCLVDVQTLF